MINLEPHLGINRNAGTSSSNSQLSSLSGQSFSNLLSESLSETVSQLGIHRNMATSLASPEQSQTDASSQIFDATSQNSAASSPNSAASSPNDAASWIPSSAIVSPFSQAAAIAAFPGATAMTPLVSTPSASAATSSTTPSSTGSSSGSGSGAQSASLPVSESYDDAYWAQQPPAVQQLRNITDYQTREQLGTQLAEQGYTIDVPIMVYGWDPSKVMATREAAGYTWVPSGLQKPVEMSPGISMPGAASYDPNNPPEGSIRV